MKFTPISTPWLLDLSILAMGEMIHTDHQFRAYYNFICPCVCLQLTPGENDFSSTFPILFKYLFLATYVLEIYWKMDSGKYIYQLFLCHAELTFKGGGGDSKQPTDNPAQPIPLFVKYSYILFASLNVSVRRVSPFYFHLT